MVKKMSNIDANLKKLHDLQKKLELDKLKIEFLNHILESARKYNDKDFKHVKEAVVEMLSTFVLHAVETIDRGEPFTIQAQAPKAPEANTPFATEETKTTPVAPPQPKRLTTPGEASPSEKMSFAMAHRELANKMVSVANDKNMLVKGKVVGLDAPFVVVAVDGGPTIKVPRGNVSLL